MKNLHAKKNCKFLDCNIWRKKKKKKTGVAMSFKANKLSRNALKTCSTGKIPIRA